MRLGVGMGLGVGPEAAGRGSRRGRGREPPRSALFRCWGLLQEWRVGRTMVGRGRGISPRVEIAEGAKGRGREMKRVVGGEEGWCRVKLYSPHFCGALLLTA